MWWEFMLWPERLIGDVLVVCVGCLLLGVIMNGLSCISVHGKLLNVGHTASSILGITHCVDSIY